MKKLSLYLLFCFAYATVNAQTNVGGIINANTVWDLAGSPYTVTSNVTVNSVIILTINSGVVVQFNDNISMYVNGTIIADTVTFTSNNASPVAGLVGEFKIGANSGNYNGNATMNGCQFLYFTTIRLENGDASFNNCSFSSFSQHGIEAYYDGNLTISGGTMSAIGKAGNYNYLLLHDNSVNNVSDLTITGDDNTYEIAVLDAATASLSNVSVQSSAGTAIYLSTSGAVALTSCLLNNNNYPIYMVGSLPLTFAGTNNFLNNKYNEIYYQMGTFTANAVLNNPGIPYYFYTNVEINQGVELTIASGNIIKMSPYTSFTVKGKLTAIASTGEKIYFTSHNDDNLGGDSNGDANNSAPSDGKWFGINFTATSSSSSFLRRTEVRWIYDNYGAINLTAASPNIDSCDFKNCYYGAMFNGASNPVFTNNTIASSVNTPIAMSFEADPIFSNNNFSTSDNNYDAIGLLGGTLTADANIIKRDFTGVPNVTYVMLADVTIPVGKTLSIAPGVVIKSLSGYDFIVNGKLLINGTAGERVVFTSVNDDNYGNPLDTRNDGTSQTPAVGNMGGFYFSETSDPLSKIEYASIRFAVDYYHYYQDQTLPPPYGRQYYNLYYDAAITINSASPTILNTQVVNCHYGIDIRGNSSPSITGNEITNSAYAPFRMAIQSTPVFGTNIFNSIGWKAIAILPEVVNYTATLSKRNIAGLFNNITYVITELWVNEGANVTLDSGLVIKMPSSAKINVLGGFKIKGTSDARVMFTSIADDNAGASPNQTDNDTESNGNATTPDSYQQWGTIRFYPSSDDAFSSVQYADFLYGGYNDAPITWESAAAPISFSNVRFSYNYGLWFSGNSAPTVDNVIIQSSRLDPLAMSYFADPVFTNITFDANGSNGIRLIDDVLAATATLNKRDVAGITNIAYVSGGLLINTGAILTINPGVVIKMTGGSFGVDEGAIHAIGTPSEKIIFTSIKDDSRGGDTNNNGNADPPASGNWEGIDARESTIQTHFSFCEFRYGSDGFYNRGGSEYILGRYGMVKSENNNMLVENCVVQFTNSIAFGAYGTSTAAFNNNSLQNIAFEPVSLSMFSNPSFSNNTIENVGRIAIRVRPETYTQSATFPFRSFAGYDSITYDFEEYYYSWYWILVKYKISSGTTITIPAGMHFKASPTYNNGFDIDGKILVDGTAQNPVVFTQLEDDDYGRPKDTQGNGKTNPAASNTWFTFNNISDDASLIDYAIIRYTDKAIILHSASPTVRNTLFDKSNIGIYTDGISQPVIENNKFRNLKYTPFTTSMVAYPASTAGNTMEGTTWKAIMINDETLTQDTTLYKRPFGGINNIPYVFGIYAVGPGVKLTIQPGVILKFATNIYSWSPGYMNISGSLSAVGGEDADSTIIFTSIYDDFYGGDTNADSTATQPSSSSSYIFQGITFKNESSDALSKLSHVVIRYSSYNYSDGVKLESASPTLTYCSFRNNYIGIHLTGASNPVLANNDILSNYYGVYNEGSFTINATGSWWGDNSGPYHATTNPDGKGNTVSDNVTYNPWATDRSLNPVTGDVSLNGAVTAYDAALALQYVATLITLNDRQLIAGDVSGNDAVSAMDASYILQYSAGLIQSFPAESTNKRIQQQLPGSYSEVMLSMEDSQLDEPGQMLSIPINISNVKDLYALEFVLKLDQDLDFVELQKGDFESLEYLSRYDASEKELHLAFARTSPINKDGVLAILKVNTTSDILSSPVLSIDAKKVIGNETDVTALAKSASIFVSGKMVDEEKGGLRIYPNPATSYINIKLHSSYEGPVDIEITKYSGQQKLNQSFNKSKGTDSIRLNLLPEDKGLYFLKITTKDGSYIRKIVISQ